MWLNSYLNDKSNKDLIFSLIILLEVILVLSTLVLVLSKCRYGFDITDEGFYLNWFENPWIYKGSISQFGYIYHPLYLFVNKDIALLRQCNVMIIFFLSWLFFYVLFRRFLNKNQIEDSSSFFKPGLISLIFASSSLNFICPFGWLVTPSYNTLVLQSLIIVSTGILLAEKEVSLKSVLGWLMIGLGGYVCFLAKPSSAAVLFILVALYVFFAKKCNVRLILLSLIVVLLLFIVTAWYIDGSIALFIDRYFVGINNLKLINSNNQFIRVDVLPLNNLERGVLIGGTIFSVFVGAFLLKYRLSLTFAFLILAISFSVLFGLIPVNKNIANYPILQILFIPFSSLLLFCLIARKDSAKKLSISHWMLIAIIIILPTVLASGTSNNYWIQSQIGSEFWVAAGLLVLLPFIGPVLNWRLLLLIGACSQLITIVAITRAMEFPYRQYLPLKENDQTHELGKSHAKLILSREVDQFLKHISNLSLQTGFKRETPMIDLTGRSPGMLYLLSAKSIGQAWLLGGYPGSDNFAIRSLKNVNCREIAVSWILQERDNTQSLSPDILMNFGINIKNDYVIAAEYDMPIGMGGSDVTYNRKQLLLKPIRSMQEAFDSCETARLYDIASH